MLCYHLILFFPLVIKSELIWLTNFENSLANCEGKNTMYYKNRKWVPFSITFFSVQKWSFQGHKIVFLQSFMDTGVTPPLKLRPDPPPKMAPKGPKALIILSSLLCFPNDKKNLPLAEIFVSEHIQGLLQSS